MINLIQYNKKNLYKIETEKYIMWFSYETVVAFYSENTGRISNSFIAKNEWNRTVGTHLNIIKKELQNYIEIKHNDLLKIIEDCI